MLPTRLEYLVFAGGGMRGLSYAGALEQLAKQGHDFWSADRQLKGVAGSSIGALFAVCLAARVSIECLLMEVRRFNMRDILSIDPCLLFYERGLDPGDKLREFIDQLLQRSVGSATITMHELQLSSRLHLIIPVTDLEQGKTLYLDHRNAPALLVGEALAMSMSLPLIFTPKTYQEHLCVDGGLMDNFPMHLFPVETTLGIRSCWTHECKLQSLSQYISRVVYCALASTEHHQWRKMSKAQQAHTISVDVGDIQTVEFHLAAEQIEQLLEQGRIAVRQMPPQQAPLQALLQTVVYQVASRAQLLSPGQVAEHGHLGVAELHHQQEDHEEQNHDQPGQDKQEAPIADV
jgi:NTE family protein